MKPQRVAVLLNVSSGDADGHVRLRAELESAFEKHSMSASLEFLEGADLHSAAERALQSVIRGVLNAIIVGGGDGSIRSVAGVLAGSAVPLGIVPLGTLNHFAKDLSLPLSVDAAVAVIASGEVRRIDVGEVNGRIFINNSSIGIYPYLVLERERRRHRQGLPKWVAMMLAGFQAIRYFPLRRLSIRAEGWDEPCRSPCVFVGNNEYRLTGPSLGSREKLDEGQLCLYVARQKSAIALLWLACRSFLGLLDQTRDLRIVKLSAVEVRSHHRRLLVAFDGEIEVIPTPLLYRTRPGALTVFAPASVNG